MATVTELFVQRLYVKAVAARRPRLESLGDARAIGLATERLARPPHPQRK